jgi:hypothetical protein
VEDKLESEEAAVVRRATTLAVILLAAVCGRAAEQATPPAVDRPAIARWIAELSSDHFATREAATASLVKAGRAAEGQLREAVAETRDPEVRNRATMILARLARAAAGGEVLRAAAPTLVAGKRVLNARVVRPGVHELSVNTQENCGVVRCDSKGIHVTVSTTVGGRRTETYSAASAAALAQAHPEAYDLYDSIVTETGGGREEGNDLRTWFEGPARRTP